MAEKTTTKKPAAAAVAAAAVKPAANEGTETAAPAAAPKKPDLFTFVKQVGKDDKLAPQARVIVNTMETLKTSDRTALVAALDGKIQTRQPIGRILSYYQKDLVTAGYITITEQV